MHLKFFGIMNFRNNLPIMYYNFILYIVYNFKMFKVKCNFKDNEIFYNKYYTI